jgi:hypothetical protein
MNATFVTKRGDYRAAIKASLKDASGQPVNLANCIAKFLMADLRGKVKVSRDAIIQDAVNGIVWFIFEANEVDEAGTFLGEFEVTYADGRVETFPNEGYMTVRINQDLS